MGGVFFVVVAVSFHVFLYEKFAIVEGVRFYLCKMRLDILST